MSVINEVAKSVFAIGYYPKEFVGDEKHESKAGIIYNAGIQDTPVILGSGFCIDKEYIITNAHVLQALGDPIFYQLGNKIFNKPAGFYGALQFEEKVGDIEFRRYGILSRVSIEWSYDFPYIMDLGIVKVITPKELPELQPVEFETEWPEVGQDVGILGYPFGEELLKQGSRFLPVRFSPSFQKGYVSAIAKDLYQKTITSILIDTYSAGGASGSPVFNLENGKVYGILWGVVPISGFSLRGYSATGHFAYCVPADLIIQVAKIVIEDIKAKKKRFKYSIAGDQNGIRIQRSQ